MTKKSIEEVAVMLEELYEFSFKKAKGLRENLPKQHFTVKYNEAVYEIGKWEGYNEAISTIALQVVGGEKLFKMWKEQIEEKCDGEEEKQEESDT